mmetsp:Transcript_19242/g.44153  ORF Transcript_19242/g.44153 Transcript_19242/m.44153 type:complete len:304 (-) Transcript_19242:215-1126(-)
MNGPSSNASSSSYAHSSAPMSGYTPTVSMPNSYSSFAGMPSQQRAFTAPRPLESAAKSPGWSQSQTPSPAAKQAPAPAQEKKPKKPEKKKSSSFICCFRPSLEDDHDDLPETLRPDSGGSWEVDQDDIVNDGVPMGGVTSTSEDVIQFEDAVLQCNVGLSVEGPSSTAASMRGPMSSTLSIGGGGYSDPPSRSHIPVYQPPSEPRSRRPPSSGTSLYSVAENGVIDSDKFQQPPSIINAGRRNAAPISASLQELQGLDDRRNQLMQTMNKAPPSRSAAPVSNTLLELQQRQVVNERKNLFHAS